MGYTHGTKNYPNTYYLLGNHLLATDSFNRISFNGKIRNNNRTYRVHLT